MSNASYERRWFLNRWWGSGCWGRHPWVGIKKWDAHVASLVKSGFLEADPDGLKLWLITDAGIKEIGGEA